MIKRPIQEANRRERTLSLGILLNMLRIGTLAVLHSGESVHYWRRDTRNGQSKHSWTRDKLYKWHETQANEMAEELEPTPSSTRIRQPA